jgi:hypothetical protein
LAAVSLLLPDFQSFSEVQLHFSHHFTMPLLGVKGDFMLTIRQEVAMAIVAEFGPFEIAVDIALARGGRVIAALTEGRIEAQVAPATGHGAIMSAIAAVAALGQARDGAVATRRELVVARGQTGLREVGIGSLMGCPASSVAAAATDVSA